MLAYITIITPDENQVKSIPENPLSAVPRGYGKNPLSSCICAAFIV